MVQGGAVGVDAPIIDFRAPPLLVYTGQARWCKGCWRPDVSPPPLVFRSSLVLAPSLEIALLLPRWLTRQPLCFRTLDFPPLFVVPALSAGPPAVRVISYSGVCVP